MQSPRSRVQLIFFMMALQGKFALVDIAQEFWNKEIDTCSCGEMLRQFDHDCALHARKLVLTKRKILNQSTTGR
ncbi:hypothetical protein WI45_18445 [Burkholderia cepacia]|nr:hypothetical protein WI45_18445 [Burkholderia cepacia]